MTVKPSLLGRLSDPIPNTAVQVRLGFCAQLRTFGGTQNDSAVESHSVNFIELAAYAHQRPLMAPDAPLPDKSACHRRF